nr:uncharacterized protein LOC106733090 [Pelodiscus sinensis]|eukprot:XP_014437222.1 uncharacterized protein LOC106733090 [Pelodiscus sinensis]
MVLLSSRKPSTRRSYAAKWRRFSSWASRRGVQLSSAPIPAILDYLFQLRSSGLSFSSIKVHVASLFAFHVGTAGASLFSNQVVKRFLTGLEKLYPSVRAPYPDWNLNLVLHRLMSPPFEPLATCSLKHLSLKVTFIVAITSARRVSELRALTIEPPYLVFSHDNVRLRPHPTFLPKVVSPFHLSQEIYLAVFFSKPHASPKERVLHSLDAKRALAFYID